MPSKSPRGSVSRRLLVAGVVAGSVLVSPALAQEGSSGLDSRAENLAQLRAEVEELSTEVSLAKEDMRARLRSIDSRVAEAESEIRREEVRLTQLEGDAERTRQLIASQGANADVLTPAVRDGIVDLRGAVEVGIPYRTEERLASVAEIEEGLDAGTMSAEDAAARLWGFAEDELRLTKENGLDKQVITLDGEEMLVEVARIGMVALYFMTEDGRMGYAARSGDGWTWKRVQGQEPEAQLADLFDALDKGIRVGWFELPSPELEVSR